MLALRSLPGGERHASINAHAACWYIYKYLYDINYKHGESYRQQGTMDWVLLHWVWILRQICRVLSNVPSSWHKQERLHPRLRIYTCTMHKANEINSDFTRKKKDRYAYRHRILFLYRFYHCIATCTYDMFVSTDRWCLDIDATKPHSKMASFLVQNTYARVFN